MYQILSDIETNHSLSTLTVASFPPTWLTWRQLKTLAASTCYMKSFPKEVENGKSGEESEKGTPSNETPRAQVGTRIPAHWAQSCAQGATGGAESRSKGSSRRTEECAPGSALRS